MALAKSKKTLAGTLAAVALTGTALAAAPGFGHPAHAVGPGDVIGGASTIWENVSLCMTNLDNDIPCTQSTATSVAEIHSMLSAFIKQYEQDRVRTMKSFDVVVANQKDAAVRQSWESVRADLETSHVGMKIYNSFLDCVDVAAHGDPSKPGTCTKVNRFGVKVGTQDATPQAIMAGRDMLVANETRDKTTGVGGYSLSPTDLIQRLGGGTTNPYENHSVLGAIVDRDRSAEVARQGDTVGSKLFFAPAHYVNQIGETVTGIADQEDAYFAVRVVAASMRDDKGFASDLQDLAAHGRDDSSPILSIAGQRKTFTFPDWSPKHPLAENQAILATSAGPMLTQNLGTSSEATTKAPLPSQKQIDTIAKDMSQHGGYTKFQQQFSAALPAPTGVDRREMSGLDEARALDEKRADDTFARWWSAPTTVYGAQIQPLGSNGQPLSQDVARVNFDSFHVSSLKRIPHVDNNERELSIPVEMYRDRGYVDGVRSYVDGRSGPSQLRLGGGDYNLARVTTEYSMPTPNTRYIQECASWGSCTEYNRTYGLGDWIQFDGVKAGNVSVEQLPEEGMGVAQ